jgi:hypothetical protein
MQVGSRGGDTGVSERLLNEMNRSVMIEGMAGVGMPHPMAADILSDPNPLRRSPDDAKDLCPSQSPTLPTLEHGFVPYATLNHVSNRNPRPLRQ